VWRPSWLLTRAYVEPLSSTFVSIRTAVMYGSPSMTGCEDVCCTKKCWSISTSPIFTRTFGQAPWSSSVALVAARIFHLCLVLIGYLHFL
jgi:hypothetical protein